MKKSKAIILAILFCAIGNIAFAQSKKDLQSENTELRTQQESIKKDIEFLKEQISSLKSELMTLKEENRQLRAFQSNNVGNNSSSVGIIDQQNTNKESSGRCQAITSKGAQCSRQAESGSNYCWQHKGTYEPNNSNTGTKAEFKSSGSSSGSSNGRIIHTGPRGGKYYYNSKGNKVYVK